MAHIPSRWRALSAVPVLFACAVCPAVAQDPEFRVAERYDREALGQLRELGVAFEEDPSGTPVAAFVGVLAPEGCRLFRRVPTVREITVVGPGFKDAHLARLGPMARLRAVHICQGAMTDAGLAAWPACETLEEVDLFSCRSITDKGLSGFTKSRALRVLGVGFTGVGDGLFTAMRKDNRVEVLDLRSTKVTDQGIALIRERCPNVRKLDLSVNGQLTDECLKNLAAMKSLKRVDLNLTGVTTDGAAWLRKQRPALSVGH